MNQAKFDTFAAEYRRQFTLTVDGRRNLSVEAIEKACDTMLDAVARRAYSKHGRTFKATFKALGIEHRYKSLDAYLERT